MIELEARIRAFSNNPKETRCEVAIDEVWRKNGCFEAKEAYCILYLKGEGKGKIVEADYRGGAVEFRPKVDYDSAPLIEIPRRIIITALTPVYPQGTPQKFMKTENMLQSWHFKPLSQEDWTYIKNNCFRPK